MTRPAFDQPHDLSEQDGSLRDVYIVCATPKDWASLCRLAAQYGYRYSYEGKEGPLPELAQVFAGRNGGHLMTVTVGRVTANCHFFNPEEIELDFDPREVHDATDHDEVLQFLEALAMAIMKRVSLTAENVQDAPYLSYDPKSQRWAIHERQFESQ